MCTSCVEHCRTDEHPFSIGIPYSVVCVCVCVRVCVRVFVCAHSGSISVVGDGFKLTDIAILWSRAREMHTVVGLCW